MYHISFIEAKRLLLFSMNKRHVRLTKQQKDDSSCGTPTTSSHQSPSTPSTAGSRGINSSRSSVQFKTEDDLPTNNNSGIADDQFLSQQAAVIDDDGLYSKTTTHEFAGKIDAPRTSSFGKMDAYNFKGKQIG